MSKIVGIMCVKDEADLLPQVYPHVRNLVDYLYVYEDGSQDDTWGIVKDADYAVRKFDLKGIPKISRPNYYHLLEKIKEDFKGEEVWCVITMGDRFFLTQTPREVVERAGEHNAVEGVQLDFLRHRSDPWTEENDPFPDYSNIRSICRWARIDERCIVAFKLADGLSYLKSKYPWPRGIEGPVQYGFRSMNFQYTKDTPYLEHQGRRSPKAHIWRYTSGSRPISKKYKDSWDLSSFDNAVETKKEWYLPYRVVPWVGERSLDYLIYLANLDGSSKNKTSRRCFFSGMEASHHLLEVPKRGDVK